MPMSKLPLCGDMCECEPVAVGGRIGVDEVAEPDDGEKEFGCGDDVLVG